MYRGSSVVENFDRARKISLPMAACGLEQIFDKPLPDNPTLIETLSWNHHHIKSMTSLDRLSFTEIFGELHFKESSHSSSSPAASSCSSSASSLPDLNSHSEPENSSNKYGAESNKSLSSSSPFPRNTPYRGCHRSSDSFSSMNSESLQLCTEGLGFESSFDVEDLKNEMKVVPQEQHSNKKEKPTMNHSCDTRRSRTRVGSIFPPPISCIGKSGKPGVCFKSFRQNGRFVLKEVRVPTQEFLKAYREDGRLKLQFIQPEDEIPEYEETDEDMDDDEELAEEDYGNNEEDKKI